MPLNLPKQLIEPSVVATEPDNSAAPILSFTGQYAFLSNFHPCAVTYAGVPYPSVEHAYQSAKTLDKAARLSISKLPTACAARSAGQKVKLRPGWDDMRLEVMTELLEEKFSSDEALRDALIATGERELIKGVHGINMGLLFWGVYYGKEKELYGKGDNWLGCLLMAVREAVR